MKKIGKDWKSVREVFEQEEISLTDIFMLFYQRAWYIIVAVVIFFGLGYIVAKTSPVEYTAHVMTLSEDSSEGSAGGLTDLMSLAGVRGRSTKGSESSTGLGFDMYQTIINSTPFMLELMDEKFEFKGTKKKLSLYEYFLQPQPKHFFATGWDFITDLPGSIKSFKKPVKVKPHKIETVEDYPNIYRISGLERRVMTELRKRIDISMSGRVVTLSVKMPDPLVASELTLIVQEKLVDYIINYKTEKLQADLRFIGERKLDAEKKYLEAQKRLANFQDANMGRLTESVKSREAQLRAEYTLLFGIYSSLAQQFEQGEFQVKKETPLFSEFEPVTLPNAPSEPQKGTIKTTYSAIGFVIGFFAIIIALVFSYFFGGLKQPQQEA